MRLLRLQGEEELRLIEFHDDNTPPYSILSHTWGLEEVTFEDITTGMNHAVTKAGYRKIDFCGKQAKKDGLEYFWVDTCCINKSSSAELTEAINSMFRWYRDAVKCYVYMSDVTVYDLEPSFRQSRWFTRG
jgi:hypothetical protein